MGFAVASKHQVFIYETRCFSKSLGTNLFQFAKYILNNLNEIKIQIIIKSLRKLSY